MGSLLKSVAMVQPTSLLFPVLILIVKGKETADSGSSPSISATPALPGDILTGTITTTEADFKDRFEFVERTGELSNYDFRWRYDETVFTIDPTITVEKIERTVPSYHKDQPFHPARNRMTVGVMNDDGDEQV